MSGKGETEIKMQYVNYIKKFRQSENWFPTAVSYITK